MNHIYIFFYFERKLEFANSFEDIYIWKVGTEPPKGGHGPSRFLYLKLRVYMFYEFFRIWPKKIIFSPLNIIFSPLNNKRTTMVTTRTT